jgi:hypothetical protein
MMTVEKPFHIQAIEHLRENYSPEHFRIAVQECRDVIAQVVAEDDSSDQQIARVRILRYLDLQLARAIRWSEDEADLMAIVLRSLIDLRHWADFVSKGPDEAARFLWEVGIDVREIHEKMEKAYPGALQPISVAIEGNRVSFDRRDDYERYDFQVCSKLIHPSALTINHPEMTLDNPVFKEQFAVEVLFRGWLILTTFHNLNWHD